MSKHLSAHPDFIEAFVSECFSNGFNEKQASDLLTEYSKAEFYRTDKDFKEGVDSFFKQSNSAKNVLNLLKSFAPSLKGSLSTTVPMISGAVGGALAPEGVLPGNFQGGAISGAMLGALLGAVGSKGRGLKGKDFLKGLAKGVGRGTLGGLSVVGGVNLADKIRKPSIDPNTKIPWYMTEANNAPESQAAISNVPNPFELPPEIMTRMRSESRAGQAGTKRIGPVGDLDNKRNQILDLENQISVLENTLPSGSDPTSYAQRVSQKSQLDNLKKQRKDLVTSVGPIENQINTDKANMRDSANNMRRLSERGLYSTTNEFDMLRRRQQIAEQEGLLGGLMSMYNRISGVDNRLAELDPIYRGYTQQSEQARRLQELAR
jgi:hypothetical protein